MPLLTNFWSDAQHASAWTVAPGSMVKVPVLTIALPTSSVSSAPEEISLSPSNVIGSRLALVPAPLSVADPPTVSEASSVFVPVLAVQVKSPARVASPPSSEESSSVRSWS